MLSREKNPNRRKYITSSSNSTTVSTSLHRASDILTCVCNDINTITDIASYLKYSTSTVHRLLQALKELEWIIQDSDSHKYYLGPLLTQLASNEIAAHKYLIMHSLREMMRLSDITEETISLAIMVQLRHMRLHEISSKHNMKITGESKWASPVYVGATAKVLLSQLEDKELNTTVKNIKLDHIIGSAVNERGNLIAQIKEIRKQGYCVSFGERIPGAICISAPINNYNYPASVNILGLESRLSSRVNELVEESKASATSISKDIASAFKEKEVMEVI